MSLPAKIIWEFPGSPVVRTWALSLLTRFDPWSEAKILQATRHGTKKEKVIKLLKNLNGRLHPSP